MIHYHGTPITPRTVLHDLAGRNFCVSFAAPQQIKVCHQIGQSVLLDNGAYSVWRQGIEIDWEAWAAWVKPWLAYRTTYAILPDSIEGTARDNEALLTEWADVAGSQGIPVWHLHESIDRLAWLCDRFERVAFGSSAEYAAVSSPAWHRRVTEAFDTISAADGTVPWIHMLRGMSLAGTQYPFSSVDSTDVARNHNRPHNGALKLAARWDAMQQTPRWTLHRQPELGAV